MLRRHGVRQLLEGRNQLGWTRCPLDVAAGRSGVAEMDQARAPPAPPRQLSFARQRCSLPLARGQEEGGRG